MHFKTASYEFSNYGSDYLAVLAGRTLAAAGPYCRDPLSRSRAFRIVGKLPGNLFIADQSRAASHAPSHYTLFAPRASHLAFYPHPQLTCHCSNKV